MRRSILSAAAMAYLATPGVSLVPVDEAKAPADEPRQPEAKEPEPPTPSSPKEDGLTRQQRRAKARAKDKIVRHMEKAHERQGNPRDKGYYPWEGGRNRWIRE